MSLAQISVFEDECYILLTDGSVQQYAADTKTWKTVVAANPGNVQIAASASLGIRQTNGTIWRLNHGMQSIGTRATKLWAGNGEFWQWQATTHTLWAMGQSTGGKWQARDSNPGTKDLVFLQDEVYQLAQDGKITRYQSPHQWILVDDDATNAGIAANDKSLFVMRTTGDMLERLEDGWISRGRNWGLVQIAGGAAGLFQRHNDGKIYQLLDDGASWTIPDGNAENSDIIVARSAYRVTRKGEIFIYHGQDWQRIREEDAHPAPPVMSGPQPAEIYDGGYADASQILMRIGNGGAGQSGLVKALADAYIKSRVATGYAPFKVAWYKSDTTESIKYLQDGTTDVAITYTEAAEDLAVEQGIALSPRHYLFREHFLLVGPTSNPAELDEKADILHQMSKLYTAAEAGNTTPPVRFLSRYDKSATSIKDSELWIKIGQVPWAMKYSNWYHQYMAYPIQALEAAARLQEYTLTDWGTYLSSSEVVSNSLAIYKHGQDDEKDLLLAPAHLLVGAKAQNVTAAKDFATWATGEEGQTVIAEFKKFGEAVYSPAPKPV